MTTHNTPARAGARGNAEPVLDYNTWRMRTRSLLYNGVHPDVLEYSGEITAVLWPLVAPLLAPAPPPGEMSDAVELLLDLLGRCRWSCATPEGAFNAELTGQAKELVQQLLAALARRAPEGARDGVTLIAAERQRQVDAEGWTAEHDDTHECGELALAAAVYACPPRDRSDAIKRALWPWGWNSFKGEPMYFDRPTPTDARIRSLVKAGALIAAEIDRLQRATPGGAA